MAGEAINTQPQVPSGPPAGGGSPDAGQNASAGIAGIVQQMMQRMATQTQLAPGVPQTDPQKPREEQPMSKQIAHTENEGKQIFMQNLGAAVQNAVQAHKEKQTRVALADYTALGSAWDNAQVAAQGDQQKSRQLFEGNPMVQAILSDPKKMKNLAKGLSMDFLNPQKNNVYNKALQDFVKSDQAAKKMKDAQSQAQAAQQKAAARQRMVQAMSQMLPMGSGGKGGMTPAEATKMGADAMLESGRDARQDKNIADQDKRQGERDTSADKRAEAREAAAEKRLSEQQDRADDRQQKTLAASEARTDKMISAMADRQAAQLKAHDIDYWRKSYVVPAANSEVWMSQMQEALKEGKKRGYLNGGESMVLVSGHMANTLGGVKGARLGRDMIMEHIQARDLPQELQALGQKVLGGAVITMQQAETFMKFATNKSDNYWREASIQANALDLNSEFGRIAPFYYKDKQGHYFRVPANRKPPAGAEKVEY